MIEIDQSIIDRTTKFRKELHEIPEHSCHEVKTKALLLKTVKENTTLKVHDMGSWFYGAHLEEGATLNIAFRADFDAVTLANGEAKHLCGHDGHSAVLYGFALACEGKKFGKNLFFLWQHAEENGEGGKECVKLIELEKIHEIYALHTTHGYPLRQIITRQGAIYCGSKGLTCHFVGKTAHAAWPESGINPSIAIAEFLLSLKDLTDPKKYDSMVMCTVVGILCGKETFGVSASEGKVLTTIRSSTNEDLQKLEDTLRAKAKELADKHNLTVSFSIADDFLATINSKKCFDKMVRALSKFNDVKVIDEPLRVSEDFAHYSLKTDGGYFLICNGVDFPSVHTLKFEFQDFLIPQCIQCFMAIALDNE